MTDHTPGVSSETMTDTAEQPTVVIPEPPENFDWHTPEGQTGYSWAELQELSATLSQSSLVPAVYRKQPNNIVFAAIAGQELGWGVTTAMRFVHIIEGKPTISPEGMLALIRRSGHSVTGSSNNTMATVRGRRADNGDEMEVSFTIADAVRAKLDKKDNWKMYPDAMLWARAVAVLARRLFSDVFLGVAYVPDEMGAVTNERGEPIETTGRDVTDEGPTWEDLKWDKGEAQFNAARRDTKRLLDMLPGDARERVRTLVGPAPPQNEYTMNLWAMRHGVVVNIARELGIKEAFEDTTPNMTSLDSASTRTDAAGAGAGDSPESPAPPAPAPGETPDESPDETPPVPEAPKTYTPEDDAADAEWVRQAMGNEKPHATPEHDIGPVTPDEADDEPDLFNIDPDDGGYG